MATYYIYVNGQQVFRRSPTYNGPDPVTITTNGLIGVKDGYTHNYEDNAIDQLYAYSGDDEFLGFKTSSSATTYRPIGARVNFTAISTNTKRMELFTYTQPRKYKFKINGTPTDEYNGYKINQLNYNSKVYLPDENYSMPSKGEVIYMNLDGISRKYRVLRRDGTQAHVLGLFDVSIANSIDTDLNTTWYNLLSEDAQNAIVSKEYLYSDSYRFVYNYGTLRNMWLIGPGATMTRNVHALTLMDVFLYNNKNPYPQTSSPSTTFFYSTAESTKNNLRLYSYYSGSYGGSNQMVATSSTVNGGTSTITRPAFTIDLSQISWVYANE